MIFCREIGSPPRIIKIIFLAFFQLLINIFTPYICRFNMRDQYLTPRERVRIRMRLTRSTVPVQRLECIQKSDFFLNLEFLINFFGDTRRRYIKSEKIALLHSRCYTGRMFTKLFFFYRSKQKQKQNRKTEHTNKTRTKPNRKSLSAIAHYYAHAFARC